MNHTNVPPAPHFLHTSPPSRWLMDLYKPKNGVPAYLEIVDIAGLVRGASSGEGLGNAFLSHIAAVDGIFHVCRAFEDPDVIHVEDRVVGGAAAVQGASGTGSRKKLFQAWGGGRYAGGRSRRRTRE